MAALTLHSHLKGFQLIERLLGVEEDAIGGMAQFKGAPVFLALEVMAQLAALHVRHRLHFERHAFLLKVIQFDLPETRQLTGAYCFRANLLSQSSHAFAYGIVAQAPGQENLSAELMIGTQDYGGRFKKQLLQAHYQDRFNQLLGDGIKKIQKV